MPRTATTPTRSARATLWSSSTASRQVPPRLPWCASCTALPPPPSPAAVTPPCTARAAPRRTPSSLTTLPPSPTPSNSPTLSPCATRLRT
eukprot:751936-Prymnesium_polylepis.1